MNQRELMLEVAKNNRSHWIDYGIRLGYPVCCVISFCNLDHLSSKPRKFNGTGFIPCAACNELKTEEMLISEIEMSRDKTLKPFPEEK